jgi:hypothetical protein
MAQIGILHGNKESFPQAVMEGLNRHQKACCRFLCVDALHQQDDQRWGWDTPVVFDLFSGQMPFLKEALHLLSRDPERTILNCPKLSRLHNRATVRLEAAAAGIATPPAIVLPARSTAPKFPEQGYVNLRFPLAWEEILRAAGPYPQLQALDFDREPGVTVEDLGALWRRYNETGTVLQELVGAPSTDEIYRVFAIGTARFVRPLEPLTRQLLPADRLSQATIDTLIAAADAVLARVPWSVSAFDLGLSGGKVEYLDANPDPFLEWWVLGEKDFAQAVDGAVDMLKSHLKLSDTPLSATSKKRAKKKGNG